jgi:uncharacterized membrane protein YfcA
VRDPGLVTTQWAAAAAVIALANFVLGLMGFGNGLVAMALLPFFMSPLTAIPVLTIYTVVASVAIFVPLRRELRPAWCWWSGWAPRRHGSTAAGGRSVPASCRE